ncbi:serine hydrolase [Solwaraspora sp. WMMD1047]|uniref:serine hydrolase domain-containing protein n=1 Tax=Solwaraspora sp. WMMD1047 TaxID=3016102 RepID=UPI0024161695|nr:serine hydrolase domain-containing protein [Solwaraspora sp. WMMD1047]MDG4830837.1 serine hydrolase [Solwaraspora sp. WMMD1047]
MTGAGPLDPDGLRRVREAMASRVAAGRLPGLVTVLARDDDLHVEAIGSDSFDGAEPIRRDALFRIGSLTKPLVAAATLRLVEDGLLDLAEPVDRLLPELADRRVLRRIDGPLDDTVPAHRPVTVADLLTSRLGLGILTEPSFNPPYPIVTAADDLRLVLAQPDPRTPHPPDEWMKLFGGLPLMSQPGERWHYNAAALVLGVLVARAGGGPLGEVLTSRLFEPLGMADTGFWTAPANAGRIPTYYQTDLDTGELTRQPLSAPSEWTNPPVFPSGAGGLLSTADDLLAFARMMINKGDHGGRRVLSAESVTLMTSNHLTAEQIDSAGMLLDPKGWGYGLAVATRPDEVSAVPGRYGWDGGYGTVWYNDPHRGLIAMALTQTTDFLFDGGRTEFLTLAVRAAD